MSYLRHLCDICDIWAICVICVVFDFPELKPKSKIKLNFRQLCRVFWLKHSTNRPFAECFGQNTRQIWVPSAITSTVRVCLLLIWGALVRRQTTIINFNRTRVAPYFSRLARHCKLWTTEYMKSTKEYKEIVESKRSFIYSWYKIFLTLKK